MNCVPVAVGDVTSRLPSAKVATPPELTFKGFAVAKLFVGESLA
jgi:hypothetical protein